MGRAGDTRVAASPQAAVGARRAGPAGLQGSLDRKSQAGGDTEPSGWDSRHDANGPCPGGWRGAQSPGTWVRDAEETQEGAKNEPGNRLSGL